jgi:hypothetical protein
VGKMRFFLKTSNRTYGPKYFSRHTALSLDVWSKVFQWIYNLKPGRMVQSLPGDFILTSRLIAPTFLSWSCFSRNKTNRRLFTYLKDMYHLEYSKTLYDPNEF